MQLTQQRNPVQITGDNVKTQQFKIQFNAKMSKILSDGLYSDKILAIIRELSTNAYDSHVAAGKATTPFHVTLPSSFNPQFIIEDFGVGLSPEQVNNIYTVYGASDKEDSNTAIGCLGLGSKTPFSYNTRSCTIESRVDGMCYIYSAFIGENGLPTLAALGNPHATTKENGVKITIPVNRADIYNFQNKAKEIYEWFNPRPKIQNSTISFDTHSIVVKGTDWELRNTGRCSAVMGSICYPISFSDSSLKSEEIKMMGHPFYIKFPIGELDIEVSREGLSYDLRTRSAITAKFKLIRAEISQKINDEIAKCPTLWEARLKATENTGVLYEYVDRNKLVWQGHKLFPTGFNTLDLPKGQVIGNYNTYYRSIKNFKSREVSLVTINRNVKFIVDDLPKGTDTRVLTYVNNNHVSAGNIYLIKDSQRKLIVDTLGLKDDSEFILASSLPKPVYATRTGTGVKRGNTENIMELQNGGRTLSSFYKNVQKDIDEGGTFFEFNTFKAVYNSKELLPDNVVDIKKALETCGIKQTEPIYAVKTAQIKRLAKAKKVWTNYLDYALAELDKVYSNLQYTNLEKVTELLNWFGRWDYTNNQYNVRTLSLDIIDNLAKNVTKKDFCDFYAELTTVRSLESKNTLAETVKNLYNTLGRKLPASTTQPTDAGKLCRKIQDDYRQLIKTYPLLRGYDDSDKKMCAELAIYVNAK